MKSFIVVFFLIFSLEASEKLVIDDFEEYALNKFPAGWGIKKGLWYTSGKGNKTWRINEENGNKFLSADSKNDSFTIGKKYKYSLDKFKFLSWKWRVHTLPLKGDEKNKKTGDSAAGIYVIFPGGIIPYSIKYVWSSTREVGTILNSPFTKRSKIIVIQSGKENIGKWVTQKRNVFEDYMKVFKVKTPDKNPELIAFLTDSDNTNSAAKADYDDIFALTE
jgi:hypothetical protein